MVRSTLVFGLTGPLIGLAALVLSAIVQSIVEEHSRLGEIVSLSAGWVILTPLAYLLSFWPALLTGAVASPLLALRCPRLYVAAAAIAGAFLSCLLVPSPMTASGAHLASTFADNAPWLIGAGVAGGLGSATIALALTERFERHRTSLAATSL